MAGNLNKQSFKIKPQSLLAKIAAKKLGAPSAAMVLGKTIHLHGVDTKTFLEDKNWVVHELTHVKQFKQYGLLKFLWLYGLESLKKGYHNNKFEVEARNSENAKN